MSTVASAAASSVATAVTEDAPPPLPAQMPLTCDPPGAEVCTPPASFVDSLCNGDYLDASLLLFGKDTPWKRGYLTRNVDGWYASGGPSARAKLDFDEEVLVLRYRPPAKSGIVVTSSGGSYDVLRWDGLCYTLDGSELTMRRPPRAKRAAIPFGHLGPRMQSALLADAKVKAAFAKRAKECKGVTRGEVSSECARADLALTAAVIDVVRAGSTLPEPDRIPPS
jgi:hypothetical protein